MMAGNSLREPYMAYWTPSGSQAHRPPPENHRPSPPPPPPPPTSHRSARDIYRNAWLKRQLSAHPFSKKAEKLWVVFCVHNDVEAFLEFYSEPKMGTSHKPLSAVSLNTCLHVSPSLMSQDNEYQFAVTLPTEVIRLVASSWEQMMEWVDGLQFKLRDMNILSPKDNLYSKLPETKAPVPVVSTRDPNSPLPPTPGTLAAASQRALHQNSRTESAAGRPETNIPREPISTPSEEPSSNLSSRPSVNGNHASSSPSDPSLRSVNGTHDESHSSSQMQEEAASSPSSRPVSSQDSCDGTWMSQVNETLNLNNSNEQQQASTTRNQRQQLLLPNNSSSASQTPTCTATATATVVLIENGEVQTRSSNNSTRVLGDQEGGTGFNSSTQLNPLSLPSESSRANNTKCQRETGESSGEESTSHSTSGVSRISVNYSGMQQQNAKRNKSRQRSAQEEAHILPPPPPPPKPTKNGVSSSSIGGGKPVRSTSSENIYELIYIPENSSQNGPGVSTRRIIKANVGGSSQRSSSLGRTDQLHQSSSNRIEERNGPPARRNVNRNRGRSEAVTRAVGNSTFFENNGTPTPSQLQATPIDSLTDCRSSEYRLRKEEYLLRMGILSPSDNDNLSRSGGINVAPQNSGRQSQDRNNSKLQGNNPAHLPLKEQQVLDLQMEINYPGGIRVTLRRKDCLNSIAFVDYLGAVWVAGWKQEQYPGLYYTFHVGDQILKVAGVSVHSSVEASRAIKSISSPRVEFILRRLPYGKVFALKRSRDGEPLGLVAKGGSGEISEVLPEGLSARYGLPPKGVSVDGERPCNWYLTEVNNFPLSLMSKENEVKDRLNAVGKEISILVQPADLVKHLRKSLKSFKGCKDYVVG